MPEKIKYIYGGYWPQIDYTYTEREYTGKDIPKCSTIKVCKVIIHN